MWNRLQKSAAERSTEEKSFTFQGAFEFCWKVQPFRCVLSISNSISNIPEILQPAKKYQHMMFQSGNVCYHFGLQCSTSFLCHCQIFPNVSPHLLSPSSPDFYYLIQYQYDFSVEENCTFTLCIKSSESLTQTIIELHYNNINCF